MIEYLSNPEQLQGSANLVLLCKHIGDTLERHYPGWLWVVAPDEQGGVLHIVSLRLSGSWGYRFKLNDLQGDPKPAMKRVMLGAGEILERFGVPRGTYQYEDWAAIRKFAGMPQPNISDKSLSMRRRERDAELDTALRFGTAGLRIRDVQTATGTRRELALRIRP